MKNINKNRKVLLFFMIVFFVMGASLFAVGSDYFELVTVDDVPCYMVPEALDDFVVSDDTVFYLPVGVYEGYELMISGIAAFWQNNSGMDIDSTDTIFEVMFDIWNRDAYGETCLDPDTGAAVAELWEDAYNYYDQDENYYVIANCLPEWAYNMCYAVNEIACVLNEVYDYNIGGDYFDSLEEIYEYYAEDFLPVIQFINTYYPDMEF